MTKFTEHLWSDLVQEHGPSLAQGARPGRGRARRPRVIAGSTLALAVAGTALALGMTGTGGTSAPPATDGTPTLAAYNVTQNDNGSVLVQISQAESLPAANHKLTAMGIREQVTIDMASGPAAVSGPVACKPAPGVQGPPLKVLVGKDGTEVIAPGTTGDNTGVGTWHLASCSVSDDTSGNTGAGAG